MSVGRTDQTQKSAAAHHHGARGHGPDPAAGAIYPDYPAHAPRLVELQTDGREVADSLELSDPGDLPSSRVLGRQPAEPLELLIQGAGHEVRSLPGDPDLLRLVLGDPRTR